MGKINNSTSWRHKPACELWLPLSWIKPKPPSLAKVHHFDGYSKMRYKKLFTHECRITCERSESARERRIALYKSDQQQQQKLLERWWPNNCLSAGKDWVSQEASPRVHVHTRTMKRKSYGPRRSRPTVARCRQTLYTLHLLRLGLRAGPAGTG